MLFSFLTAEEKLVSEGRENHGCSRHCRRFAVAAESSCESFSLSAQTRSSLRRVLVSHLRNRRASRLPAKAQRPRQFSALLVQSWERTSWAMPTRRTPELTSPAYCHMAMLSNRTTSCRALCNAEEIALRKLRLFRTATAAGSRGARATPSKRVAVVMGTTSRVAKISIAPKSQLSCSVAVAKDSRSTLCRCAKNRQSW